MLIALGGGLSPWSIHDRITEQTWVHWDPEILSLVVDRYELKHIDQWKTGYHGLAELEGTINDRVLITGYVRVLNFIDYAVYSILGSTIYYRL